MNDLNQFLPPRWMSPSEKVKYLTNPSTAHPDLRQLIEEIVLDVNNSSRLKEFAQEVRGLADSAETECDNCGWSVDVKEITDDCARVADEIEESA